MNSTYNISPFHYTRVNTREVKVKDIGIGGENPIRIQSMTNTDTQNTQKTVNQIIALKNVGCEIVRLAVSSIKDAENLVEIKKELKKNQCKIPLIADIHFSPTLAMKVVENVDKVRVNPGNFVDKKKFIVRDYTEVEYIEESEKVADTFIPLVQRCKDLGVCIRIGVNHGSLSDRIMNRYGDSPLGMVESALEFIRIAESESFHELVLSMKSSNPMVMIQAYRLLWSRFIELNMNYPLHLGVTEAGDGKDGRIKSSIGIGSLLEDGLGDTIRVSLTEDPVHEIPVAQTIVEKYSSKRYRKEPLEEMIYREFREPFSYKRIVTNKAQNQSISLGGSQPIKVFTSIPEIYLRDHSILTVQNKLKALYPKPDVLYLNSTNQNYIHEMIQLKSLLNLPIALKVNAKTILSNHEDLKKMDIFSIDFRELSTDVIACIKQNFKDNFINVILGNNYLEGLTKCMSKIEEISNQAILSIGRKNGIVHCYRKFASVIRNKYPIVLSHHFKDEHNALYDSSIGFGSLILDGIGDAIHIEIENDLDFYSHNLSFDILHATRQRIFKADFISCPSCGRTLFDIQEVASRIKKKTSHLTGVKIAIMGCIVNGPGEMADADFGYVGAGAGKVHLYKGKEIVEKSIPYNLADEKLILLIKNAGMWTEP